MYKNCPLLAHDKEFSVDLISLSKHQAIVDCDKKIVLLKCSDLSEVTV